MRSVGIRLAAIQLGLLGGASFLTGSAFLVLPQFGFHASRHSAIDSTAVGIGLLFWGALAFVSAGGIWRMRKWGAALGLAIVVGYSVAFVYDNNDRLWAALMVLLPILYASWLLPSWSKMSWWPLPFYGDLNGAALDAHR